MCLKCLCNMKSEYGQVYSVCILLYCYFLVLLSTPVCSQNINKQTEQTTILRITAFSVGITILNQRIILKDEIEFVAEFPCLSGHPVLQL